MYTFSLTENEMQFLRQLVESDLAITIKTVEIVAGFRTKVLKAEPDAPESAPTEKTVP
jgi:hypothetical protein